STFHQSPEHLLERGAGSIDPGSDGTAGYPQDLLDFFVRELLDVPEDDHFSVLFRQLLESLGDLFLDLALAEAAVRARPRIGREPARVAGRLEKSIEAGHATGTDPATDLVLGQVDRDRVHPGAELAARTIALAVHVDAEEDLLGNLLCAVAVADEAAHEVDDPVAIPVDERREGSFGTPDDVLHQTFVRKRRENRRA